HEPRLVPEPALHHRLDRHIQLSEDLRDPRQHAGLVRDVEVQVERRGDRVANSAFGDWGPGE
ncbi:MAG TPA: hypothetical protein VMJ65_07860, partial [Solirubrobacteraceae bacterium]|nr:hypothetical protein [Solirubrobacteraceae bacterium]